MVRVRVCDTRARYERPITITLQHYNNNQNSAGTIDPVVPRAGHGPGPRVIDSMDWEQVRENHNHPEKTETNVFTANVDPTEPNRKLIGST